MNQQLLISWSGLRGAASIVFAIMAIISPAQLENDIFHMVFFIVLFSILLQGTLLPRMANQLNMIDEQSNVMKTFTDYSDEMPVQFIQFRLPDNHPWCGKQVREVLFPPDTLLVLLQRNGQKLFPNGDTALMANDSLILSAKAMGTITDVMLYEKTMTLGHPWIGLSLADLPLEADKLIILIKRQGRSIIPSGKTVLYLNDVLVINQTELG